MASLNQRISQSDVRYAFGPAGVPSKDQRSLVHDALTDAYLPNRAHHEDPLPFDAIEVKAHAQASRTPLISAFYSQARAVVAKQPNIDAAHTEAHDTSLGY